ncbi:hypothetical protein EMGBS15_17840 [Filimonas sp.]|nr:hypothetical protein EMGBS15_17840 [Filimonas sp.]
MIEVGSFIGMAAMTGGDLLIKDCNVNTLVAFQTPLPDWA